MNKGGPGMGKKFILLLLTLVLIFSSIFVYGERMFTDVPEDYWGYQYINKIVSLGLMDGYDDATFRANEPVNAVEALVYITRLIDISEDEVEDLRQVFDILLDKYSFSEEEKNAISIAIDRGLITQIYVENKMFSGDDIELANKANISIYIAKAMGMELKEPKTHIFHYNDADKIPENARPYINFLIESGVLEKTGDANGNFNPDQNVTRAVLAKMLSEAYNAMNKISIIEPEPIEEPDIEEKPEEIQEEATDFEIDEELESLSGNIILILQNYTIIDNGQDVGYYTLADDTKVTVNGKISSVNILKEEMKVDALVTEDNIIKELSITSDSDIKVGVVEKVFAGETSYIIVRMEDGGTEIFNLYSDSIVVINGSKSELDNVSEGDQITVELIEDSVLAVNIESENGKVIGSLKEKQLDEDYQLLVEREDGTTFQYKLSADPDINRDSERAILKDIRPGDKVRLALSEGKVYKIDAKSVPGKDKGYIESILIADEPVLTIKSVDGDTIGYFVDEEVIITMDEKIVDIYDLRLDYLVDLDLKSDEIVNINVRNIKAED